MTNKNYRKYRNMRFIKRAFLFLGLLLLFAFLFYSILVYVARTAENRGCVENAYYYTVNDLSENDREISVYIGVYSRIKLSSYFKICLFARPDIFLCKKSHGQSVSSILLRRTGQNIPDAKYIFSALAFRIENNLQALNISQDSSVDVTLKQDKKTQNITISIANKNGENTIVSTYDRNLIPKERILKNIKSGTAKLEVWMPSSNNGRGGWVAEGTLGKQQR